MSKMEQVVSLGSLWESTMPYVNVAIVETKKEKQKREEKEIRKQREELQFSANLIENQKDEIGELLSKAKISPSLYFPFKTKTNKEGELEFIPKNIYKMKKDSKKCKEKLEEALKNKKITEEEFNLLNENLDEMLKENGLDEEKEKEEELTNDEINMLYDTFNESVNENMDGLIAQIGEKYYNDLCIQYDKMDKEEKKQCLTSMNKEINKHLKISGNIDFSNNKNLSYENSFVKGGYLITEKDVSEKQLSEMTRNMMEQSMVRKLMTSKNQNLNIKERKALVEKIMKEKALTKEQALNARNKTPSLFKS